MHRSGGVFATERGARIGALANAVVRRMTRLDRQQVNRLIHELAEEGGVRIDGHGRGALHAYVGPPVGGE